uniref:RING-type domain-containing protein n=1 Tax=Glossina brevipalpis TaxID=37001 RepID=A0A1A9WIV9_9MUSC
MSEGTKRNRTSQTPMSGINVKKFYDDLASNIQRTLNLPGVNHCLRFLRTSLTGLATSPSPSRSLSREELDNTAFNAIRTVSVPELYPFPQLLGTSPSRSFTSRSSPRSPIRALDRATGLHSSPNVSINRRIPRPNSHSEFEIETPRINRICGTPDHNLRSEGFFIGNSNATSSSLNTSYLMSPLSISSINSITDNSDRRHRKRTYSQANSDVTFIDLTQLQASEHLGSRSRRNMNDDIMPVGSHNNEIIDLTAPMTSEHRSVSQQVSMQVLSLDQSSSESSVACRNFNRQRRTQRFSPDNSSSSQQKIINHTSNTPKKALDKSSCDDYSLLASALSAEPPGTRAPFLCPICMESTLLREPTSTRCGHVFCQRCIRRAIEVSHKCPVCKSKEKRLRKHFAYDSKQYGLS